MIRRFLFAFVTAMALFIGAFPVVTGGVVPVAASTATLPACNGVYKDVLTADRAYSDWSWTLADTIYMVSSSYYPSDLVSTGVAGGGLVRSLVKSDLLTMAKAVSIGRGGQPGR